MKKKWNVMPYPRGKMRDRMFFLKLFLFACFFCTQMSLDLLAQDQRVTLKFKGITFKQLFNEIEKQSGLSFVYTQKDIEGLKPLDVDVKNGTVKTVLDTYLKGTKLVYSYTGNYIVLKVSNQTTPQEKISVHGQVKDLSGLPLPGVSVVLKGTSLGVATDTAGIFRFSLPKGKDQILVISFLGMKTKEIHLGQIKDLTKKINVTLEEDALTVDEVVVTGYGNIKKSSFTGKVVSVSGEELKTVASRNIISALQVFDPSLRIKENNNFGSDPNALPEFNIRGNSSIGVTGLDQIQSVSKANLKNNTNLPIFIMDGFEVTVEKVYDMDMSRVESINILKDAAATAMYGSRAANGVIVITTVKPKAGELRISYNFLATVTTPDLSDYNLTNASEKLEAERLAGLFLDEEPNEQILLQKEYYDKLLLIQKGVNTDWISQPLRNVFNHKHTLYMEGGSGDAMRFGLDFKYDKNNGVMKGSFREVMSIGLNLEYRLKNVQIRNTVSYSTTNSEESPYGLFSKYSRKQPYDKFLDSDGKFLLKTNSRLYNDENPLYDAQLYSYDRSNYAELIDNLNVNWNIASGIQLRGTFSVTKRDGEDNQFVDPASSKYKIDDDPAERGELELGSDKTITFDGNCMFYVYKTLYDSHLINLNVGINVRQNTFSSTRSSYRGFPLGTMDEVIYARTITEKPTTDEERSRLFGYVGSLNYSFKDIYLFDVSGRLDGSSEFGTNNKFAPFWAVGIGLNFHKYAFMENHPLFSRIKVRGSIGQLGKVNFPAYAAISQYEPYKEDWYSTGSASKLVYLGNPDLKWEITKTTDAGFELGLLNDRFVFDFSYYRKHTRDLITTVTIPASSGFRQYRDNMGEVINKGFELDVRANIIKKADLMVVLMGNVGHNKNRIGKISASLEEYNKQVEDLLNEKDNNTANDVPRYEPIPRYVEGGSTTSIFAMKSAGIDPANGRDKFIKRDGTSTYDYNAADEVIVGDIMPDYQGSFGLNVYYKGFSLFATFMYEVGAQKYNSTLVDAVENADIAYSNVDRRVLYERWMNPGDVTPLKDIKDRNTTTKPTSRFVQDDNWLSLSYVSLGYDINTNFLRKMRISQCNFQLSTSEPFRWSSMKRERGLSYPFARSYNFTMNLMF